MIVMFPGEWRRDPASSFLHSAYHDVPREESGLVRECIGRPWEQRGWLALAWGRLRPTSHRLCGTERTESPIYR